MVGVSVQDGIEIAKEILSIGNIELLAVEAAEIFNRHHDKELISRRDRFIIGLAYSEFYTDETTTEAYYRAEIKRQNFLKMLGINGGDFVKKVESLL